MRAFRYIVLGCILTGIAILSNENGFASDKGFEDWKQSMEKEAGIVKDKKRPVMPSRQSKDAVVKKCVFTLIPENADFQAKGGEGRIGVDVSNDMTCTFNAESSEPEWIVVQDAERSNGNGRVSYTVLPNNEASERQGLIRIGDKTHTVRQDGFCHPRISSSGQNFGSGGGEGSVQVDAADGCTWVIDTPASWVTINTGFSGVGKQTVAYTVIPNPLTEPRTTVFGVAGCAYSVFQEPVCTISLTPLRSDVGHAGAERNIRVTGPDGCRWHAVSNKEWLRITSPAQGTGNGALSYAVDPVTGQNIVSRTGIITIENTTFTVTQTGCGLTLSPIQKTFNAPGGDGTLSIRASNGCGWTVFTENDWITFSGPAQGNGNGQVMYRVSPFGGSQTRVGYIKAGYPESGEIVRHVIRQTPCTYHLSPRKQEFESSGGRGEITVSSEAGCGYNARSDRSWIRIPSLSRKTGQQGALTYTVEANISAKARNGSIIITGQNGNEVVFAVDQKGRTLILQIPEKPVVMVPVPSQDRRENGVSEPECHAAVSPSSATFRNVGGDGVIAVSSPHDPNCEWRAVATRPWITLTSADSGTGEGHIRYTVSPNGSIQPRDGSIAVKDTQFTVIQEGSPCYFNLSSMSEHFPSQGGERTIEVSAQDGCEWTAATGTPWMSILAGSSGSGNGAVTFSVMPHEGGENREGAIRIAGRQAVISQSGPACDIALSPLTKTFPAQGGTDFISIGTGNECPWKALSHAPWITILSDSAGTGSGTLRYFVPENPDSQQRQGAISVSGVFFSIVQNGRN